MPLQARNQFTGQLVPAVPGASEKFDHLASGINPQDYKTDMCAYCQTFM